MAMRLPLAAFCIILSVLYVTIATVYHVIPDENYSSDDHSHNLQYYLNDASKYFASNNELQFLPGEYALTDDILVNNVKNFSLVGNITKGVISTIVTCTVPAAGGVVVTNSSDIIITNIVIKECNLINKYDDFFYNGSLLLQYSGNILILNVWLSHEPNNECTLQVLNIFGILNLSDVKANCLNIYYDEIIDNVTSTNRLHINNYQTDFMSSSTVFTHFITIFASHALYDIDIAISNTVFTKFPAIDFQCYEFQGHLFITVKDTNFTNIINLYNYNLVNFIAENCVTEYNGSGNTSLIQFINCSFINNTFTTGESLLDIKVEVQLKEILHFSTLQVFFTGCTFQDNKNSQLVSTVYYKIGHGHGDDPTIMFLNTLFTFITLREDSFMIYVDKVTLFFKNVVINHVNAYNESAIIAAKLSDLHFQKYVEMSACTIDSVSAIIAECMYIDEYSVVNFTANSMKALLNWYSDQYNFEAITPMMLSPCIFQYTSKRGNLDSKFQSGNALNYSIFFIYNNIGYFSHYRYAIFHCGWIGKAAFLYTRASVINKKVIQYINDSLEYERIPKRICSCDSKDYDCYQEDIGPFYPGQTVTFHFIIVFAPIIFENLLIKIEDGPETACSTTNKSVLTLLPFHVCTEIKYTVQHKSGKECDLYIKGVPHYKQGYSASPLSAITEFFYVKLLPCPTGFVLLERDGRCQCDPVLLIPVASIETCYINDQTILRHPNSWITGTTINDSHIYNVSSPCPFDYCLPYSSNHNLLNPDSQCQFNRTGVLCGQCHQGLSAVFGSSQCKKCSSVYLLLVIPIAIAGITLVMLLFILNLTVTDGDVNAFLLYVNVVSINAPIFLHREGFYHISYVLISLTNLDLGIETCFYNGMDDYAKMWLQLTFPIYLIIIATTLIMASRYSIRVQRLTARKALPILATLFLLSYTKVLRTISSVLFFYNEIITLPSKHSTLVWSVDTSVPLFGIKYTFIFVVSLILFLILLFFNVILTFTRSLSYFKFVYRFKPLLDAYQGPYKDKYYYWTGLQLVMRAVFFGLSALDRNTNLMISSILTGIAGYVHGAVFPFKNKAKNIQEHLMILNLNCLFIFSLYTFANDIAVTVLIFLAFLQFLFIVLNHIRLYLLSIRSVSLVKMKADTIFKNHFNCFKSPTFDNMHMDRGNLELIPKVAYNFREFREPL